MLGSIQNPGSALGEAIGAVMESALNNFLSELAGQRGFHYVSKGAVNKAGKPKKLLLYDSFGTAYNIDAVIANESMQPIILLESKYIRYKKHNRDKGSWICTAHPAIRRRYGSIRSSIAILAGNWSRSSIAMMRSHDINIFSIPFSTIQDLLTQYQINFAWEEKDRAASSQAWERYIQLTEPQKHLIGQRMVALVRNDLAELIVKILDDSTERAIEKITVELHSNLGEVKVHEFADAQDAIDFLAQDELGKTFTTDASFTLFDGPPPLDDN